MAQILRVRIPDYFMFVRTYGTRSTRRNHYDTLRISPSSTQKEIRSAYVKLTKETHPDVSKTDSHKEFVAINEAYRVLSKEDSKKEYDQSLRYSSSNPYANARSYHNEWSHARDHAYEWRRYSNYEKQEFREASRENSIRIAKMCLALMIFGSIFQFLLVRYSTTFQRDKMLEKSRQIELEIAQLSRAAAQRRTPEQREAFLNAMLQRQKEYEERMLEKKKSL